MAGKPGMGFCFFAALFAPATAPAMVCFPDAGAGLGDDAGDVFCAVGAFSPSPPAPSSRLAAPAAKATATTARAAPAYSAMAPRVSPSAARTEGSRRGAERSRGRARPARERPGSEAAARRGAGETPPRERGGAA